MTFDICICTTDGWANYYIIYRMLKKNTLINTLCTSHFNPKK